VLKLPAIANPRQQNVTVTSNNNMTIKQLILLLTLTVIGLTSCKQKQHATEIRDDFKKYYDQFHVEGYFVLYDQQNNKYILYNQEQAKQTFTPASTFKICNSLIGLETGVIKDESFVIPWDSVTRQNPNWNTDHDLKTAFKNSTVWYYQELARRVGGQQMKYWLDKANYGNADTSGGIDRFWLTGGLRISVEQQIDFLKRLHDNKLPFSQRSLAIVKNIMIAKDTLNYVVRAKTGWGAQGNKDIGWYVGYIETKDNVYYFANCIQSSDLTNKDFANSRIDITYLILEELKLTRE
jgi:beta-lactamase class D